MISFKLYYEANIANVEIPNEDGYSLKGELDDYIAYEARRKPNLEPGGAIYKWFTNNLMKF